MLALMVTWLIERAVTMPVEDTTASQSLEQRQSASKVTSFAVPVVYVATSEYCRDSPTLRLPRAGTSIIDRTAGAVAGPCVLDAELSSKGYGVVPIFIASVVAIFISGQVDIHLFNSPFLSSTSN